MRLGVLASGSGTNLQALLDACQAGRTGAEVALVVSNVPTAGALARAAAAGVAADCLPSRGVTDRAAYDAALVRRLQEARVDVVCLAGYMRLVTPTFLQAFGPSEVDGEASYKKSLNYMGFNEGDSLIGTNVDYVFLGSCTNGRIEDFRAFASVVKGKKKADNVTAWLVPGSHIVEAQIKEEGILDILTDAGFALRQPGCSACLAMNDDKIPAGKLAVSTSNRNFEGRQGPNSRTMLASPLVAAAAAVTGKVTDPREFI